MNSSQHKIMSLILSPLTFNQLVCIWNGKNKYTGKSLSPQLKGQNTETMCEVLLLLLLLSYCSCFLAHYCQSWLRFIDAVTHKNYSEPVGVVIFPLIILKPVTRCHFFFMQSPFQDNPRTFDIPTPFCTKAFNWAWIVRMVKTTKIVSDYIEKGAKWSF